MKASEQGLTSSFEQASGDYRTSYAQTGRAVGRARRDVVEFAKTCGFSGQSLDDIEAAVGEGLANAVEHAQCDAGGIEVAVRREASALVVEIKDNGNGFDHGTVCSRARPPLEALRGFGTFIMRELMDEIDYTEFGTRLRLMKRLPAARAQRWSGAQA